jgi:hypothetical protein
MEFKDAEKHAKLCLGEGGDIGTVQSPCIVWGEEVQAVFERRRAEIAHMRDWVM